MKLHSALFAVFAMCVALAAIPSMAGTIYDNGPTDPDLYAWTINLGYIVSDTFNVGANGTNITGANFAMWLYPGDTLTSAELSITSGENGGTSYFDQTVNFTRTGCVYTGYGLDLCLELTSFNGPTLNSGTYWLNLQNASVPSGNPVYWDENFGPSLASQSAVGSIPSEAFTILGAVSTTTTATTPEPSGFLLLGSGILSIASLLRLRIHR